LAARPEEVLLLPGEDHGERVQGRPGYHGGDSHPRRNLQELILPAILREQKSYTPKLSVHSHLQGFFALAHYQKLLQVKGLLPVNLELLV
jgi:hypothetical protein